MKKRVLSVILCVTVFLCSFSITAFAEETAVEYYFKNIDEITEYSFDNVSDLPDAAKNLLQAYVDALKYPSMKNISDVPKSWLRTARDGTFCVVPIQTLFYYLDENGILCLDDHGGAPGAHHSGGTGGGAGHHRVGDGDMHLPAEKVKQDIKDSTLTFYPTGNIGMVSWKNDVIFGASQFNDKRARGQFTLFAGGTFFGVSDFTSGYAIPFYYDGVNDDYYFPDWQILLTTVTEKANINISKYPIDNYDISNPLDSGVISSIYGTVDYPFWRFHYRPDYYDNPGWACCESLVDNVNDKFAHSGKIFSLLGYTFDFFKSSDLSVKLRSCDLPVAKNEIMSNTLTCDYNFGFYISDKPIKMDGWAKDIDVDKISDNDIITITGDTIYDYKITNSTTGDTNTITEYMNNNYTYITNNPGGDSGSSGGVGGNVTVGGNVNVSGNVNVGGDVNVKIDPIQFEPIQFEIPPIDINVNVSGGGSGSGSDSGDGNESPGDYIDPGEVDTSIDDYLQHIPEVSKGFIDYLKDFFSWLPKEIYGLLILGLLVAVFCRLNGR